MRGPVTGVVMGLAVMATAASAQVTVNPGALDLLPSQPARRAPAAPNTTPARPSTPARRTPAKPAVPPAADASPPATPPTTQAGSAATAAAPAAKPTLPTIPPAIAALPPAAPVPPPRPQPAPVVPVAADAPGSATPIPGGIRVTFGKERQDLNPGTEAALRTLAKQLRPQDTVTINIYAYATGTAEDASTARRLALARALSARAVLINEGIASTRIYPRALGAAGGDTDKDRVDVVAGAPGPPASASPPVLATSPATSPTSSPTVPAK